MFSHLFVTFPKIILAFMYDFSPSKNITCSALIYFEFFDKNVFPSNMIRYY